ncbi:MAG: ATP-binding protein [Cyclobacteriaceae bacterium]
MELEKARKMIASGEGDLVEFKKKANHPDKIVREVVAFANTKGGHLFVGVADDGAIAGLKHPEEDEFALNKAFEELCKPEIGFKVETLDFGDGRRILHYEISEGKEKPHFAFLEKTHRYGKAFIRLRDHSIQASPEMRKILKDREKESSPIPFEESTSALFKFLEKNMQITLSQYCELSGLNKKLASNKLVSLALSGALKIEPQEGEDLFLPVQ